MRTFTLVFESDGLGEAKRIEFNSEDAHEAFVLLSRERERRRVQIYEGAKFLGVIRRTREDGWQLG